jgi:hypothetical protein
MVQLEGTLFWFFCFYGSASLANRQHRIRILKLNQALFTLGETGGWQVGKSKKCEGRIEELFDTVARGFEAIRTLTFRLFLAGEGPADAIQTSNQ